MMRRSIILVACPLLILSATAFAKTSNSGKTRPPHAVTVPKPTAVHTRHSVKVDGRTIHYTATAGTLILKNKKNQGTASVFYIAYTKNGAHADHRPVTFAYNGGPGFASALVDIGGFGPMRIKWPEPGDSAAAQPPYQLVPNQYSILKTTDIVFIDAIGTGYSRIVGKGKPKDFYGIKEDGAAFKQFVEQWLTRNHRWNSPKFLLGESYGTTRNAVLANDLVNDGVYLNGVIMCSTVLQFSTINSVPGNDLPFISYLPSYAAVAWYHHRLDPRPPSLPKFVHKVEKFAAGPYAHALFEGAALSEADKKTIAAKLANYTGLPESLWLKADLRMTLSVFRRHVMGNDTMTGRYDERFTTYQLQPLLPYPGRDNLGATTSAYLGALTATMNRYLAQSLKYHSDRPYVQSSDSVFKAWDWKYKTPLSGLLEGVGNSAAFESPNVAPALARAMSNDPGMQLMMNNGYYDTATPFFATVYTVRHMGLPKPLYKNIHWHYYPVGHMLYLNPKALPKVDANIDSFIEHAAREHSNPHRG
ncbi:MAG TPA: peptidase S10 [Gammaproteobacteria bacterium]|nr:peptidase S10 [Gammaproteobacteria bacterium]